MMVKGKTRSALTGEAMIIFVKSAKKPLDEVGERIAEALRLNPRFWAVFCHGPVVQAISEELDFRSRLTLRFMFHAKGALEFAVHSCGFNVRAEEEVMSRD